MRLCPMSATYYDTMRHKLPRELPQTDRQQLKEQVMEQATIVEIMPTKVWIESGMMGERAVMCASTPRIAPRSVL